MTDRTVGQKNIIALVFYLYTKYSFYVCNKQVTQNNNLSKRLNARFLANPCIAWRSRRGRRSGAKFRWRFTMRVERRGVGVDCGRLFGGVLMENRDGKRGREQCAGDLAWHRQCKTSSCVRWTTKRLEKKNYWRDCPSFCCVIVIDSFWLISEVTLILILLVTIYLIFSAMC